MSTAVDVAGKAIMVWRWDDAPEHWREQYHDGDEELVILLPPLCKGELPWEMERLLGEDHSPYKVMLPDGSTLIITRHA